MGLESATYISGLVEANPPGTDVIAEGDNHLRLIKTVLKNTFPNADEAMNGVHTGTSEPTPNTAGQLWFDTTASDGVLKVRNKADDDWDNVDTAATVIPTGVITLWYGAIGAIPSGWSLCDGGGDTPDLRDRFIVGAGTGGSYAVDATGGSTTSGAHTLLTAEMPAHTHSVLIRGFSGAHSAGSGQYSDEGGSQNSGSTGGGGAHSHAATIPPYYALCYIMKT